MSYQQNYTDSDLRARIQKQKEQWMREREVTNQAQELSSYETASHSSSSQAQRRQSANRESKNQGYQPEMVNSLFAKMSEKLEQKYSQQMPQLRTKRSGQDTDTENSLHNQVMSNTCPVCFELFLPPKHQPYILFPCGHTFCKGCIEAYAKVKKMCPFCRSSYNSMAPNISLQNLILSANEKK